MAEIIDLDVVLPEDIGVRLNDTVYTLPGNAPVEQLLRISSLGQKLQDLSNDKKATVEDALSLREDLAAEVENLFRIRDPELPEGSINLDDDQLVALLGALGEHYQPTGDGGRPTQTPPRQRSSRPSPRRSAAKGRKASASSTSSQT